MWPWSHLAVGYVAFSFFVRFALRTRPSDRAVVVLVVATQLPDLIDKPLAWQFGLVSNGVGVAHSLLVGVPIALAAGVVLWRRGAPQIGVAVAVGHTSHVGGDLLFSALFSSPPVVPSFLWPLYKTPVSSAPGLGAKAWQLLGDSRALLGDTTGLLYFLAAAVMLVATAALWVDDGTPGWTPISRFVRGRR